VISLCPLLSHLGAFPFGVLSAEDPSEDDLPDRVMLREIAPETELSAALTMLVPELAPELLPDLDFVRSPLAQRP